MRGVRPADQAPTDCTVSRLSRMTDQARSPHDQKFMTEGQAGTHVGDALHDYRGIITSVAQRYQRTEAGTTG
jgi:hypothetical protein